MRSLKLAVLALALFAAPAFAASVTVTGVGQSWALDYNGIVDVNGVPTVMPGLHARVGYKVTALYWDASIGRTIMDLDITVKNTSDPSVWQNATVSGIGFNTNPNVTRFGSGSTGAYGFVALNQQLPTGAGFVVEVCVSGYRNICNGPANNATMVGQTASASVQLAFRGQVQNGPITIDNFGIRYADLFSSQLNLRGVTGMGVPVTPPIPEPASAALFGLGAAAVAGALRMRKR